MKDDSILLSRLTIFGRRMIEPKKDNFYFEPVQDLKIFSTSKCSNDTSV